MTGYRQDWRLTAEDLKTNHLPQELEAYPFYPEGIHIPVSEVGNIILTSTSELQVPSIELGVYNYEMSDPGASTDVFLTELESIIIHLLTEIRHDTNWSTNAAAQINKWRG